MELISVLISQYFKNLLTAYMVSSLLLSLYGDNSYWSNGGTLYLDYCLLELPTTYDRNLKLTW